jgi:hypothetical protein
MWNWDGLTDVNFDGEGSIGEERCGVWIGGVVVFVDCLTEHVQTLQVRKQA